jgi:hypothetical protein
VPGRSSQFTPVWRRDDQHRREHLPRLAVQHPKRRIVPARVEPDRHEPLVENIRDLAIHVGRLVECFASLAAGRVEVHEQRSARASCDRCRLLGGFLGNPPHEGLYGMCMRSHLLEQVQLHHPCRRRGIERAIEVIPNVDVPVRAR